MARKQLPWVAFSRIATALVVFNFVAVFGLDTLLHDDPEWYGRVVDGNFPWWMVKFNAVSPFTEWIGWNIMTYSPPLARGIYVLALMVPLSCCFFYLAHVKFRVPLLPALAAAVLPNILPGQWQIPAGINMSYVLWGMLAAALSCLAGLRYLDRETAGLHWLAAATAGYLFACEIMEQALFLYPPLLGAFFVYRRRGSRVWRLAVLFSLVAAVRAIHILLLPRLDSVDLTGVELLQRIALFVKWSLPVPQSGSFPASLAFMVLLAGGLVAALRPGTTSMRQGGAGAAADPSVRYSATLYAYFMCWTLSTIFVFLTMSEHFYPRYTYVAAYGMNALAMYSLFALLGRVNVKPLARGAVFAAIILASGTQRAILLEERFAKSNRVHAVLKRELRAMVLPPDSQIVLGGAAVIAGGWRRSSGYLQYLLDRTDVAGLVSPVGEGVFHRSIDRFYPPERDRAPRWRSDGFAIERPTFLVLLDGGTGHLRRMDYVLQWQGDPGDAGWTLLGTDRESGKLHPFRSGRGVTDYRATLDEMERAGISRSRILWEGPRASRERKTWGNKGKPAG